MVPIIPEASYSAVAGFRRETDRMAGAATQVARMAAGPSRQSVQGTDDSVELSSAARAAGSGLVEPQSLAGGVDEALIDLRVAKYAATANLRTLAAADHVSKATGGVIR